MHNKINNLMNTKQITQSDNPDLVFIYHESQQFVDYFWRTTLREKTKWIVIAPKSLNEAIIIYKELRCFGETILIQIGQPIVIIKNLKQNFKDFYRKEIILPIADYNLDLFLNVSIEKQNLNLCQIVLGDEEEQILGTLLSKSQYIYFGKIISEEKLNQCQMLMNMKFHVIECVRDLQTFGYFVHRDFLEKTWIYHFTKLKKLENVLNFNEIKLTIPV